MHPGISTSLERLIELRFRAHYFTRARSHLSQAQMLGRYSSRLRGRGLDFAESRHYQVGDELKSIDWRVTARTQQTHTKLFTEEKERPMLLALDQRLCMAFGSKIRFKSVQAAELGALLIWNSHQRGDRVGGFLWNDRRQIQLKPKASQSATLHMLSEIAQMNRELASELHSLVDRTEDLPAPNNNPTELSHLLRQLRRVSKPGTCINLISDFSGFDEYCIRELAILRKHCEINAYRIVDKLERELPREPALRFTNHHDTIQLNSNLSTVQNRYHENYRQKTDEIQRRLHQLKIQLLVVNAHDNLADGLSHVQ